MTTATVAPPPTERDPRRWLTLGICITVVLVTGLDASVLSIAIPTILRDFHTTLPTLQWAITGYSLTFATFLIIGGRLGDLYGRRRMFVIGAGLFGVGSLIAAVSTSAPMLIFGDAVVEGMGASLMLPATLAILSTTFDGDERAFAFATWGAFAGFSGVFGPVVGGYLTSYHSWRWAFGINCVVTPMAIVGAYLFVRESTRDQVTGVDYAGAAMVAVGMFLLVFGLSEGEHYGWLVPHRDVIVGGTTLWYASWAVSMVAVAIIIAIAVLTMFVYIEMSKERRGRNALFEFGQLRHKRFRYGIVTTFATSLGQFALLLVFPVFLQESRHLTPVRNGLWQLPSGIFLIFGAQLGARLTRRIDTVSVVRVGLTIQALGMVYVAIVISPHITFWQLMPGFAMSGMGSGFSFSQLTNVVLADVVPEKSGVASGANSTARQIGASLGTAVIGSLLAAQTLRYAVQKFTGLSDVSAAVRDAAIARMHTGALSFVPPPGAAANETAALSRAFVSAVAEGSRIPFICTAVFLAFGILVSFLIPSIGAAAPAPHAEEIDAAAAEVESVAPLTPDTSVMADASRAAGDDPAESPFG